MWPQVLNALTGIWIMIAPALLAYQSEGADLSHITGPVITSFAVIAFWEVTKSVRLWNIPLGLLLLISPLFINFSSSGAILNQAASGFAVIVISLFKGKVTAQMGGGWSALWKK